MATRSLSRPRSGRSPHPSRPEPARNVFTVIDGPFRPRRRLTLPRDLAVILLTVTVGLLAALGAIAIVVTIARAL